MVRNIQETLDLLLEEMNCRFALYLLAKKSEPWQDYLSDVKVTNAKKYLTGGYMIDRREQINRSTDFMFLTNTLLKCFKQPLLENPKEMSIEYADLIGRSLLDFYKSTTGKQEVLDEPLGLSGEKIRNTFGYTTAMIKYQNEVHCILIFLEQFLGSRTAENESMRDHPLINELVSILDVNKALNERSAQAKQLYHLDVTGRIMTWFCSSGLFPLIWSEIKFCVDNKLKVKACPFCGLYYVCPPNNPDKGYCGDKNKCGSQFTQARAKARHGGSWEAERKTRRDGTRKGQKGRPKSEERLYAEKRHNEGAKPYEIRIEVKKKYGRWFGESIIRRWIKQLDYNS